MRIFLLFALLALSSCGKPAPPPAVAVMDKPMAPKAATYDLPNGSITVLEVPVSGMQRTTEYQTCFVLRDTNGSQMQCPNDRRSYTIDPPEN